MKIEVGMPESSVLSLTGFTETELELIGVFIYNTKLGQNISPHRDATYTILCKLEEYFGINQLQNRVNDVNMRVQSYDPNYVLLSDVEVQDAEFDIRA